MISSYGFKSPNINSSSSSKINVKPIFHVHPYHFVTLGIVRWHLRCFVIIIVNAGWFIVANKMK